MSATALNKDITSTYKTGMSKFNILETVLPLEFNIEPSSLTFTSPDATAKNLTISKGAARMPDFSVTLDDISTSLEGIIGMGSAPGFVKTASYVQPVTVDYSLVPMGTSVDGILVFRSKGDVKTEKEVQVSIVGDPPEYTGPLRGSGADLLLGSVPEQHFPWNDIQFNRVSNPGAEWTWLWASGNGQWFKNIYFGRLATGVWTISGVTIYDGATNTPTVVSPTFRNPDGAPSASGTNRGGVSRGQQWGFEANFTPWS